MKSNIDEMTHNEKRMNIAEACGAKWWKSGGGEVIALFLHPPANRLFRLIDRPNELRQEHFLYVPNYLGSLDAMHGAEKSLSFAQTEAHAEHLCRIAAGSGVDAMANESRLFALLHATARQRAEAFLLTISHE